jgi:hypothetical protein
MLVRPISAIRGFVFPGAFVALLSLSCASKPSSGGPGTYRGVLVGAIEIGIVEVAVAETASGPLPASGTIDLGGTVVSLAGALDQSNASLSLSSPDGYQLAGDSRPAYVTGSFQDPQDAGKFALYLEPADGSSVRLFCGSFVSATTGSSPSPFAVAALPSGSAICVGPNITWLGTLDANDTLACENGGGLFSGNVEADGGNQWGTGVDNSGNGNYGTWTVAPCGNGAADGGVDSSADSSPDAGASETDNSPDAGASDAADGPDAPASGAADGDVD